MVWAESGGLASPVLRGRGIGNTSRPIASSGQGDLRPPTRYLRVVNSALFSSTHSRSSMLALRSPVDFRNLMYR